MCDVLANSSLRVETSPVLVEVSSVIVASDSSSVAAKNSGTSLVALAVVFLNYCIMQGNLYICSVQTPLSFWHVVNKLAVARGSL